MTAVLTLGEWGKMRRVRAVEGPEISESRLLVRRKSQPTGQGRRRRGVPDRRISCPSRRHIPATPNIETLTATREVGRDPSGEVAIAERSQNIRLCGLKILNRGEPHNIQNSAIDRREVEASSRAKTYSR
ncbi:uncharacterized protein LOC144879892 [Branchiostoma floridae x Branchiostoma japonicum]